ncbi:MAG: transporter substrate-binding domain-containing protein [Bacteroidales bacterium]|nr:transporter substrate-binding domain-containing protein [Bacteroidales bacterium]MCF8344597.1 transporter substrate-binding domain-containing protein [Bacteroidales bacterium]MCF8352551.1 transporter substrate-binding domain-containing protein [Bacteroidales bacterium]MCF8376969.1 transporter substrate-binding domain-containing protein [Bacteroidales bacterium]MCF8400878.1 transporter substrate-binding domain-containing protein [Bacteroidales bacterium]
MINYAKYYLMLSLVLKTGFIFAISGAQTNYLPGDTIYIASEPDYPPYCIIDANGYADGFSVELFKASADAVGLQVDVKIGIWNKIMNDLAEGRIDALPLVGRTPEREKLFDFTMPYLSLHGAVFVRQGTSGINSIEDLQGKEVLVMEGDNAEEFVSREQLTDKIITTNTFEEAFRLLSSGEYDAVVTQRVMGLSLLNQLGINNIMALDFQLPGFRQDFCFAVQEGDSLLLERLNEGLSIVIASDMYKEIRLKWFGPEERSVSYRNIFLIVLLILIPIVIILIVSWIISLRRTVNSRTKSLNKEIKERKKVIDALKISEETYRNLFQNAQVGLFRTRISDGQILESNEQLAQMFGYPGRKEIIADYKTSVNYVDPGTREEMLQQIEIYGYVQNFEARFYRKDRSIFWANYSARINNEQGWIEGVVEDITDRKEAEIELRRLKENLEKEVEARTTELNEKVQKLDKSQKAMLYMVEDLNRIAAELKEERRKLKTSNQELEAFTYSVSHDLRAPLRAINGFSKFLLDDYSDRLDDEGKRFIDTIRRNASKMDQLISDLLNLSRVSRSEMRLSDVDMKSVAVEIFNDIAGESEKKEVEFVVDDLPRAKCDPTLIRQVWGNLIGNALKYSAHSKVKKIEISAKHSKEETSWCVKDSGAGFDPKYMDKLFGIFQRLHKAEDYPGTGVGLAIVQRIIHRHGGKVQAKGETGKGAEFCFSLPHIAK